MALWTVLLGQRGDFVIYLQAPIALTYLWSLSAVIQSTGQCLRATREAIGI